jgi:hypothetical protein
MIEGLNDGKEWTVIDERNTRELCSGGAVRSFKSNGKGSSEYFRKIRITQLGKNSYGNDNFFLFTVEFFGGLKRAKSS